MSTRPIPGARHRAARSAARIVVLGLVAAAVAGVASAAFGRLIMRSFTLVAGGTPAFSWPAR